MTVQSTVNAWLYDHLSIDSSTEVRLLGSGAMPRDMGIGMENFIIDGEWAWVAVKGGRINGFLAASPCHGTVMVLRLVLRPRSPFDTLPLLLRQFARDCRNRGFIGFFTLVNPARPAERALMGMMEKLGAARVDEHQLTMAVNFDKVMQW